MPEDGDAVPRIGPASSNEDDGQCDVSIICELREGVSRGYCVRLEIAPNNSLRSWIVKHLKGKPDNWS